MAFHFCRVRKAGGLVVPRSAQEAVDPQPDRVPTVPNLLVREAAAALVVTAALVVATVFLDAPLEGPANPGMSPNPTRAPWYFAGIQELLLHLHPAFAVCAVPVLVVIGLMAVPHIDYEADIGGIWFASKAGRKTAAVAALVGLVATPPLIFFSEWFSGQKAGAGGSSVLENGLIPTGLLAAALTIFFWILWRRDAATKNEAVQAIFVLLVVAYIVLTLSGVWFRGEGMVLRWPW